MNQHILQLLYFNALEKKTYGFLCLPLPEFSLRYFLLRALQNDSLETGNKYHSIKSNPNNLENE